MKPPRINNLINANDVSAAINLPPTLMQESVRMPGWTIGVGNLLISAPRVRNINHQNWKTSTGHRQKRGGESIRR